MQARSLSTSFRRLRIFLSVTWLALILAVIPHVLLAANFYGGTAPANVPWPGGVVPYQFTNLTAAEQTTYLDGLREWELAGGVKFVPYTNQSRWILFSYNTNFVDHVSGGDYSPQQVTVSSLSRAQVCHEMGHSFGFNHENIRVDATNYIVVITNNIANYATNVMFFTNDPTTVPYGNYDFESVMHLGWDFASTNPGVAPTIQPKPPNFPRYQFRLGNYCLSPGDRAALTYLYGPPLVPLNNVVTNTADVGPGTLRAAVYYATDHAASTVRFNIPVTDLGYSNGVFNIHLTGHLPPLAANGMVIDGSTQPGFTTKPIIFVDASQIIPETFTSDTFLIYSSSNQIKNISLSGFDWNGLTLLYADATNNTISGCWFGLDSTGAQAAPNAFQGILVASGASGNIFGGTNALARNVLSGNTQYGIFITDSNTTGNVVIGNYLGTDATGSNAVPNVKSGVIIGGSAYGNIIGSTNSAGRNVLSGNNEYGIYLSDTTGNVILGNYLGVNASGETALPNALSGVALFGGTQNIIGGTTAGAGNVLSGNTNYGIDARSPAIANLVQGNLIGLDAKGTNAIANLFGGVHLGSGIQSNTIGGTITGARNVISGNDTAEVFFTDAGTSGNLIEGNYIGTDITGTNAIPNSSSGTGIYIPGGGAPGNIIGGTVPGAGNVISGNYYGIYVAGPGNGGNLIEGNYIGLSPDGTYAVGSAFSDIILFGGTTNNIIGGTTAGAGNVISGAFGYGIYITDIGTSGNQVLGNIIGADRTGTNALGNGYANLRIQVGATNNVIGGIGAGAGNVIAFANGAGVAVTDNGTTNNTIRGNSIFSNGGLGIDLNDDGVTLNNPVGTPGPNNLQNFPVLTNAYGLGGSTVVMGKLNSAASQPFFIDVYRNLAADPSGYGQGQYYLGTVSVTTDGSGNASFVFTNNTGNYTGQQISATATAANGDTSEFGADVPVTNLPVAFAQFGTLFSWSPNGFIVNLTFETNFSYHVQGTTNLATDPIPWVNLTNFTATSSSMLFTDRAATNFGARFYRVVSP